jgi:hypothetical protein
MDFKEVLKRVFSNRITVVLLVFFIIATLAGILMSVYYKPECLSYDCFQEKMRACTEINFINEQESASWKYSIMGREGKECHVKVTLLQIKKGEIIYSTRESIGKNQILWDKIANLKGDFSRESSFEIRKKNIQNEFKI